MAVMAWPFYLNGPFIDPNSMRTAITPASKGLIMMNPQLLIFGDGIVVYRILPACYDESSTPCIWYWYLVLVWSVVDLRFSFEWGGPK